MTYEMILKSRANIIKAMNSVVYMIADEDAFTEWRSVVPYENRQKTAILDMAAQRNEEAFANAVRCFNHIIRDYDFFEHIEDLKDLKDNHNAEFLKGMNYMVCHMNNENAYYFHWINIIPDCADDEELEYIAEEDDETFVEAIACFKRCVKRYACKSGYCIATFGEDEFGNHEVYGIIEESSDDDDE